MGGFSDAEKGFAELVTTGKHRVGGNDRGDERGDGDGGTWLFWLESDGRGEGDTTAVYTRACETGVARERT